MKLTDTDYYVLACMFKGKALDDATEQRASAHCRTILAKLRPIEDLRERWDYAFYARLLSRVDFQRIRTINTDAPPPPRGRVCSRPRHCSACRRLSF
jgi:hypothetical protein